MDIAYNVAQYLANNGFGTLGADIFVGYIPAEETGLYITRLGGTLNNYIPIEETILDIYARNTSAADAITQLEQVKQHLHRMHNTTLTQNHVYSFLVLGDVEDVQRDENYDKIFKITVQVTHRNTALIS